MWQTKFTYASAKPRIRGVTFGRLDPNAQLAALVKIAAGRLELVEPTSQQLAGIGGISVQKLLGLRHKAGAPIRPKRASVRKADPTPAPEPANVDIIDALRRIGSSGFLKIAEMVERDEIARAAAATKANSNGAALNGGASHYV
jgi:hypothetical protein